MGVILSNPELIESPPIQPTRYGLFNAATVVDMPTRVIAAGLTFYAIECGDDTTVTNQTCVANPTKTANEGLDRVTTSPYWLTTRKRCGTVGRSADDIRNAARAQLNASEQREVESQLWDSALAGVLDLVGAGATIVVPGADGAGAAISALENAYYQQNGYVGTIHVNTVAEGALQYAGMLNLSAGVLRTPVGSAVSLGAGYGVTGPAAVAPAAGFVWAFMTGYTTVWRSTDAQIPQPDPERVMDQTLNQWDVVAERVYAAAWSCPEVFAVQVPIAAPSISIVPTAV